MSCIVSPNIYSSDTPRGSEYLRRSSLGEKLPAHEAYLEQREHQKDSRRTIKKLFKCILVAGFLAYSIAAFCYDFQQAKLLFIFECVAVGILILRYVYDKNKQSVDHIFTQVEQNVKNSVNNKPIPYLIVLAAIVVAIMTACTYKNPSRLVSALGFILFVSFGYVFSWKRQHVNWRPIVWGFCLQFIFALCILKTKPGYYIFEKLGEQITVLLTYTDEGSGFVFGYLTRVVDVQSDQIGPVFAFKILPTVIFFSSLVSIMYYLGILQCIVRAIASVMSVTLGTSASESLNAAANIFIGQTETPLLIRPFLEEMTMSELHAMMTNGFASIAGGVLAIYISKGISAPNLIASCVMSAPGALAVSKLLYPETEQSATAAGTKIEFPEPEETNIVEAASNGAAVAVSLVANIAGMLIAFLSLVKTLDSWLSYFCGLIGFPEASFGMICGYLFFPIAAAMGVPLADCTKVAELIGTKIFLNEFVAYTMLKKLADAQEISKRAYFIATYALCGFSNFGSVGVTLGALSTLAPSRSKDIAKLVVSAMIGGNIACFITACIAGILEA